MGGTKYYPPGAFSYQNRAVAPSEVKSALRADKLKSVATDAATALASGVSSLFGSGKMKSLEFHAIHGSDARKMSLWKRWDCRQAEDKIVG